MDDKRFIELFEKPLGAIQSVFEFRSLLNYLESFVKEPKAIIEVGVATGGTFRLWRELLSKEGLLIGVDINYRADVVPNAHYIEPLMKEFEQDKRIHFVIGDSTKQDTIQNVKNILNGIQADILFIDANHTTEYVTQDFNNYKQFVRSGGYICFHDIVNPCVKLLWDKIVAGMEFEGYCEFWRKNRPMGIGLMKKE